MLNQMALRWGLNVYVSAIDHGRLDWIDCRVEDAQAYAKMERVEKYDELFYLFQNDLA